MENAENVEYVKQVENVENVEKSTRQGELAHIRLGRRTPRAVKTQAGRRKKKPGEKRKPTERKEEQKNSETTRLQMSRPEELTSVQQTNRPQNPRQKVRPVSVEKATGRNEKVKITNGSETKELKWKKAKPLVESGQWKRV